MTAFLAMVATALAVLTYLAVGFSVGRRTDAVADLFPIQRGRKARIGNAAEFSAATVAMTVSLATVVMAFFELAPAMGLWLLWSVVTTAAGIFVVRLAAGRIWRAMERYGRRRPTLHEFLGVEYGAKNVGRIAAAATSLGFLGAFAVELTVGSRLLAGLMPQIPALGVLIGLVLVVLAYTTAGGFRAVIVVDRIQMAAIWVLLTALVAYYLIVAGHSGGIAAALERVPSGMLDLSWREGLGAFVVGLFVINVPTFLSDMSTWQRIGGSKNVRDVTGGLLRSVVLTTVAWGLFVGLACLLPMIVAPNAGENPLLTLVRFIGAEVGLLSTVVVVLVVFGLYGAMLSTASTQLIAVAHTVHQDLLPRSESQSPATDIDPTQVRASRMVIVTTAVIAIVVVEILSAAGFSIVDLVFAIYGAQLGLFPPVALALFWRRERLTSLAPWTAAAIVLGFVAGWSSALTGKAVDDSNLVFLAPAVSLVVSIAIVGFGAWFGSGRSSQATKLSQ